MPADAPVAVALASPSRRRRSRCAGRLRRRLRRRRRPSATGPSRARSPCSRRRRSPSRSPRSARQFEADHPGTQVTFNFAASSALATADRRRARRPTCSPRPARRTMKQVTDAGDAAGTPVTFAANMLEIAVPPGNPAQGHRRWPTSPSRTLKVALCAPRGAVRRRGEKVFAAAEVTRHAGHAGGRRQGGADQGAARRGRRGAGLRDRRAGGRRQGRGHRVPGGGRRRSTTTRSPSLKDARKPADRAGVRRPACCPPTGRRCSTEAGFQLP